MTSALKRQIEEIEAEHKTKSASLAFRRNEVVQKQRSERAILEERHQKREAKETAERAQRHSKGFRGLWGRLIGKHSQVKRQNELETLKAMQRDRTEKDALIHRHLEERRTLHLQMTLEKQAKAKQVEALHHDIATYLQFTAKDAPDLRAHFREATPENERLRRRFYRERDREPEPER